MADFSLVSTRGEIDEIYTWSLILAHSLHYAKNDVIYKTGNT